MEPPVPETTVALRAPQDHEDHLPPWFEGTSGTAACPQTCARSLRDRCEPAKTPEMRRTDQAPKFHKERSRRSVSPRKFGSALAQAHETLLPARHGGSMHFGGLYPRSQSRKEGCAGCLMRVTEPPELDVVSELSAMPPDHSHPRAVSGAAQLPALPRPRRAADTDVHVGGPALAHPRCRRARRDRTEADQRVHR